ncbi:MAG: FecR domain-containing protein [Lachnospiraceae bacterium]
MGKDKWTKWLIIVGAVVLVALVALLLLKTKSEKYRLIKADSVEGTVYVDRETKEGQEVIEVFHGMQFVDEDRVEVMSDSFLSLLMDEDKHMGAEENTMFRLYADGSEEKGNIRIELISGKALFEIEHKLNEESSFEVTTPNAMLSVRGTKFSVFYDESRKCTIIEVMDGVVLVEYEDGSMELQAGETLQIDENGDTTQGMLEEAGTNRIGTGSTDETGGDLLAMESEEKILLISQQYLNTENYYDSDLQIMLNVKTMNGNMVDAQGLYITDPRWTFAPQPLDAEAERIGNEYLFPHRTEIDQFIVENGPTAIRELENGEEITAVADVTEWFPETMLLQGDSEELNFQVTKVEMSLESNYSLAHDAAGELYPAPQNSFLEGDNYVLIGTVCFDVYGYVQ